MLKGPSGSQEFGTVVLLWHTDFDETDSLVQRSSVSKHYNGPWSICFPFCFFGGCCPFDPCQVKALSPAMLRFPYSTGPHFRKGIIMSSSH